MSEESHKRWERAIPFVPCAMTTHHLVLEKSHSARKKKEGKEGKKELFGLMIFLSGFVCVSWVFHAFGGCGVSLIMHLYPLREWERPVSSFWVHVEQFHFV